MLINLHQKDTKRTNNFNNLSKRFDKEIKDTSFITNKKVNKHNKIKIINEQEVFTNKHYN
jgi:hypothetical protein